MIADLRAAFPQAKIFSMFGFALNPTISITEQRVGEVSH